MIAEHPSWKEVVEQPAFFQTLPSLWMLEFQSSYLSIPAGATCLYSLSDIRLCSVFLYLPVLPYQCSSLSAAASVQQPLSFLRRLTEAVWLYEPNTRMLNCSFVGQYSCMLSCSPQVGAIVHYNKGVERSGQ